MIRTFTKVELEEILKKHLMWLDGDPNGVRANLRGANLTGANLTGADLRGADLFNANLRDANLTGANLRGANLTGANLTGADLFNANLRGANLTGANLTGANLTGADLRYANLRGANLSGADLRGANLSGADLRGADLFNANLSGADLSGADLTGANLSGADLTGADLTGANLSGADLTGVINLYYPLACPEKGSFIAFKAVRGRYIVELKIPEDALRCSATTRKCRASKAKVISITNIDGTPALTDTAYSKHDETFAYKVGEVVKVDNFDPNRWNECAPGIHFFITRQEAVNY